MLRYASMFALALCTMITPLAGSTPAAANMPTATVKLPVRTPGDPTPLPTLGRPQAKKASGIQVTINTLRRDSAGFVTLVWTVRNSGSDRIFLNDYFGDRSYQRSNTSESGPTLVDETARLRYNSIQIIPSQQCACTDSAVAPGAINSGEWNIMYNTYRLPPNVTKVTVDVPGWAPMKNVTIG